MRKRWCQDKGSDQLGHLYILGSCSEKVVSKVLIDPGVGWPWIQGNPGDYQLAKSHTDVYHADMPGSICPTHVATPRMSSAESHTMDIPWSLLYTIMSMIPIIVLPNRSWSSLNNHNMPRSKPTPVTSSISHGIIASTQQLLPGVVCEGWVLKKRRKKMQGECHRYHLVIVLVTNLHPSFAGFARRYFTLYHSGILSYSFEPGQPVRDQVSLHQSAISTAPGRKDIHIDSNTATFHIKCLSINDFNAWMAAFRSNS